VLPSIEEQQGLELVMVLGWQARNESDLARNTRNSR
jgi:hypothetical protein